ncbi:hypothetical protein PMAG_b0628 [Pseudoalteromonas mariniglutinosa NCIMB 1770]|nr:hypothetical protein [Pseudoalteromonas mariniglutinosa NCIMB 1770]
MNLDLYGTTEGFNKIYKSHFEWHKLHKIKTILKLPRILNLSGADQKMKIILNFTKY